MKRKWEYLIEMSTRETREHMNELGRDGWELVAVTCNMLFYKRVLPGTGDRIEAMRNRPTGNYVDRVY